MWQVAVATREVMGLLEILVMCTFCEALRCGRSGSGVVGREMGLGVVEDALLLFRWLVWWYLDCGRFCGKLLSHGTLLEMEGVGL